MNKEETELKDLLNQIDNVELIPDEELKNMDFYELAYYMQTLNAIDAIGNTVEKGDINE